MQRASRPALAWLLGKRVQRVDGPQPGLLTLTLYERGEKQTLLLAYGGSPRGVGARAERPKGQAASAFVQRLRQLEGGRLRAAEWLEGKPGTAAALRLTVERGEHRARILADFDARAPNLFLLRDDDTIAGAADERARRQRFADKHAPWAPGLAGVTIAEDAAALLAQGEALIEGGSSEAGDALRKEARTRLRAALKKAERKAAAIAGDVAREAEIPRLRREASLLLCSLAQVPRGATSVRLLDQSVDPEEWLELSLDPALDARTLAQQRFDRARRIERGLAIARARLSEAQAESTRLRELDARVAEAAPDELAALLAPLGLGAGQPAPSRAQNKARMPFRRFYSSLGESILVGKGAADNDTLTLTVARPHDHWLHVRDSPGAHVVVPLDKKAQIGPELLLDAATLAAHFSKQRGEAMFEIAHTERRFVRKLKGTPPGTVNLDRERVFVLRFEAARLARLLASERT